MHSSLLSVFFVFPLFLLVYLKSLLVQLLPFLFTSTLSSALLPYPPFFPYLLPTSPFATLSLFPSQSLLSSPFFTFTLHFPPLVPSPLFLNPSLPALFPLILFPPPILSLLPLPLLSPLLLSSSPLPPPPLRSPPLSSPYLLTNTSARISCISLSFIPGTIEWKYFFRAMLSRWINTRGDEGKERRGRERYRK